MIQEILDYTIFSFKNYELKVYNIVLAIAFAIVIALFTKLLKQFIYRSKKLDTARKYSLYTLLKYFIYVIALVLILQILGINLSLLIAGSAALLVGLGLGIQNIFSDYVSGIIILFDGTLKVGDVIEVNNTVCKVKEIRLRTTIVATRDDKYLILPNTDLTRNQLINWTLNQVDARFEVQVGVAYGSDVALVKSLLLKAAADTQLILKEPQPFVRFTDFGESALQFSIMFWVEEVFRVENIKSELRENINKYFKANHITIPFPQRVIHNPS